MGRTVEAQCDLISRRRPGKPFDDPGRERGRSAFSVLLNMVEYQARAPILIQGPGEGLAIR
jgi:hypothetical protein